MSFKSRVVLLFNEGSARCGGSNYSVAAVTYPRERVAVPCFNMASHGARVARIMSHAVGYPLIYRQPTGRHASPEEMLRQRSKAIPMRKFATPSTSPGSLPFLYTKTRRWFPESVCRSTAVRVVRRAKYPLEIWIGK